MTPITATTQDWTDAAFDYHVAMCARLDTNPIWVLGFMFNESGCKAWEVCRAASGNPVAVGLNQILCQRPNPTTPSNLEACGWTQGVTAYLSASPEQQLAVVERYLTPHKGKIVSQDAAYLINFLPADIGYGGDPSFVLVDSGERAPSDLTPVTKRREEFYVQNVGLDRGGALPGHSTPWMPGGRKGYIRVGDLGEAVTRACGGPRWLELLGRLGDAIDRASPPPSAVAPTDPAPPSV